MFLYALVSFDGNFLMIFFKKSDIYLHLKILQYIFVA